MRSSAADIIFETFGAGQPRQIFAFPPGWHPELAALADELGFPATGAAEIERLFREAVRRIETAKSGV
jgi:hypothetical protein